VPLLVTDARQRAATRDVLVALVRHAVALVASSTDPQAVTLGD
jgi:hypothetical protein